MSQVTEQSVRFQTALASIKLIQASAVLDLTEDDFDFLTSNKVWIEIGRAVQQECRDRSRMASSACKKKSSLPSLGHQTRRTRLALLCFQCFGWSCCSLSV